MKRIITGLSAGLFLLSVADGKTINQNEIAKLRHDVDRLMEENQQIKSNFEDNAKSGFQLAGYASFDYADTQNSNSSFSGVKFAPIFHYKYADIIQFEGELEFTINSNGETDVTLEYAAGTLFINDYMGIQMGKFLSPIGQFVQNLHPSWINKMPSAPLGFGHDGAAPTSNIGLALRGGLPKIGKIRSNYVIFVSNAPTFGIAADGDVIIDTEVSTTTNNSQMTVGGRYAINPIGNMEIGISAATGEVTEILVSGNEYARSYDVFGTDMMYNYNAFSLKAEYIQQKIGNNPNSPVQGGSWRAWYTQFSYQFSFMPLEPVLRYGSYDNPEATRDQWAIGLNYLFTNSIIAKIAYESNRGQSRETGEPVSDNDRVLAQFAFGF